MGEDLRKFKGRITSSKFETDEENYTKVITVVEDRSKIPSAQGLDFRLPNSAAPLLATEPAPASDITPVTVTTTVTTTTRTEVRREPAPIAGSGSGGMASSGSSEVGTGPASSWGNDQDDAPPAYSY